MALTGHGDNVTLVSLCILVITAVFFSSRIGRNLVESVTDRAARGWRRLSIDLIPGLFHLIMDFFTSVLELVQRFLYTIDEWLRFRSGEGPLRLIFKAVAGAVWFVVTYVVRLAINVFLEPQINPVKHFPVVTVSHKIVWTAAILAAPFYAEAMGWEGKAGTTYALGLLSTVAWMIPGMFGFIAWELKENWFLYRANRPAKLRPVAVGSHGETMVRLLRRGFHSGTVPKLHAKLRRAEYRGRAAAAHKLEAALHHVAESVKHYLERELVSLLNKCKSWNGLPLSVGEVWLAPTRIRAALRCPALDQAPVWLVFDEQQGWLVGSIGKTGWLAELTGAQRRALAAALTGLYKTAAVALIREQIQSCLPTGCCAYDITPEQLVVWPDANYEAEVIYRYTEEPKLHPHHVLGVPTMDMPTLTPERLIFARVPMTWEQWVTVWELDSAGVGLPDQLLPGIEVLPRASN
jgi:hypothetical protein